LNFSPLLAGADTVFLRNGRELKVEKAWQEGNQVWLIYHGMKASIPQSKVLRVENESPAAPESDAPENHEQDENMLPSPQLPQQFSSTPETQAIAATVKPQKTSPEDKKPLILGKEGLADLKWGARCAHIEGLERKDTDSGLKDVLEYVRPQDSLKLGDSELLSVVYAFWRDQLYTISVWTRGQENYVALRKAVFDHFGKGTRLDDLGEKYLWSGASTDIMLKYTDNDQYGLLWMRSKALDRKFKLSNMKKQTSYLRWMKSKK
jgi:hypothetical protein